MVNITVASVSLVSALLAHFLQNEKCVNLSWWVLVAMMLYMCMTAVGSWIYLGKQEASKMKGWLITASLVLLLTPVGAAALDWKMKGSVVGLFKSA